MSKVLDYLPLWIVLATVAGLLLLIVLLCRLWLVPLIVRWYDGRDVVPTTALLAAAGPPDRGEVTIMYTTSGRESSGGGGVGCAVCLEEYKDGEMCATIVACNHRFHSLCVLPWVIWHHSCPLCRIAV